MRIYELVKFYENNEYYKPQVIGKGYTLEEAQAYCSDPETSSYTAQPPKGCGGDEEKIKKWHGKKKHWFVGFRIS